jgi:hypothetical protein
MIARWAGEDSPKGRKFKGPRMDQDVLDRIAIRQLLDNWVLWRDAGMWEQFRTVWHPEGRMLATWTQGTGDEFIAMNKEGWAKGVSILHFQGAHTAQVSGVRAISMTKMHINQRAKVHDVLVDVVCTGRFYDFLEKRDGKWGFILRQPIYEKDRMDPVTPGASVPLEKELLESFPEGYRHLAYLQHKIGYPVKKNMPGLKGERVEALYRAGDAWLAGEPLDWGHD